MKNIQKTLMLLTAVLLFSAAETSAQIVVRFRPHRPANVVVRTVRPSPRHVWVGEEWTPSGNTYVYKAGYWAAPARPGAVWVAGHWANRPRGYVWVPGHWR